MSVSNLAARVSHVLTQFMSNEDAFTLLDVSEAVKADGGDFATHEEIKDIAKPFLLNLIDTRIADNYERSEIEVQTKNGPRTALLFHPHYFVPSTYVTRSKSASAPSCCGGGGCANRTAPVVTAYLPVPVAQLAPNQKASVVRAPRYDGKVEVPRSVLVDAGLADAEVAVQIHPNSMTIVDGSNIAGVFNALATKGWRLSHKDLSAANLEDSALRFTAHTGKVVVSLA